MEIINRSAIVVMPAQPFLGWLHRVDVTSTKLTLADLRRETTIYLLPARENEEAARECLRDVRTEILEEQLDGWYRVQSAWPLQCDFDKFTQWFEYRVLRRNLTRCLIGGGFSALRSQVVSTARSAFVAGADSQMALTSSPSDGLGGI